MPSSSTSTLKLRPADPFDRDDGQGIVPRERHDEIVAHVETAEFLARSSKLMSDEQRTRVVEMLARDPECGEIMRGTGGVRKVRVALPGRGKSGGARVIYYFHSEKLPLFALTVFAKNERANLTLAERNAMALVVRAIKHQFEG